jgi:hypothetical protein
MINPSPPNIPNRRHCSEKFHKLSRTYLLRRHWAFIRFLRMTLSAPAGVGIPTMKGAGWRGLARSALQGDSMDRAMGGIAELLWMIKF